MTTLNEWDSDERGITWKSFADTYQELYDDYDYFMFDLGEELKNFWYEWDDRYNDYDEDDEDDAEEDDDEDDDEVWFDDDGYCRKYSDTSLDSYIQDMNYSNSVENMMSYISNDEQDDDYDIYGIRERYLYT